MSLESAGDWAYWAAATLLGLLWNFVSTVSLLLWNLVSLLAGGAGGASWRWIVVEEGLLLALVLVGAYAVRRILGRGVVRGLRQWSFSVLAALPFAAIWVWYSFILAEAIRLGSHPEAGRGIVQMTWGLPVVLSLPFLMLGGVLLQIAVAVALGSLIILVIGHTWAG